MANFEQAYKHTLFLEGGYSNHPADRGGKTKFGITHKTLKVYNKDMGENFVIDKIDLSVAMKIYRKYYWDALHLNNFRSQAVANELFDTGVNMGIGTSAKFLQESCNLLGHIPLKVDGRIGPLTINASDRINSVILLKCLNGLQFEKYRKIIRLHPRQKVFFKGWLRRV